MALNFVERFLQKKSQIYNLMEIPPGGAEIYAEGQRQTDRQTDGGIDKHDEADSRL